MAQEHKTIRLDMVAEGMDGGPLLAVRGSTSLCFYDWETGLLVRRIEMAAKRVYWNDSRELVGFSLKLAGDSVRKRKDLLTRVSF